MAKKTFQYGGFTFEPAGQFSDYGIKPGKDEFRRISKSLYYNNRAGVADGDEEFDYDEFYKASTDKEADVFLCLENNVMYVPIQGCLAEFNKRDHPKEVLTEYYRRRRLREEEMRGRKKAALKNASFFTPEQHDAYLKACKAIDACYGLGVKLAVRDDTLYAFRADTLTNLTENMVPRNGQAPLELLYDLTHEIWDANDGLYANVKEEHK